MNSSSLGSWEGGGLDMFELKVKGMFWLECEKALAPP